MKKRIKVITYELEYADEISSNFKELLEIFQDKFDEIPDEFKSESLIEIQSRNSWGDTVINASIFYWRNETDAEHEERIADEERRKNRVEIEEKQTYERLKRKFEEGKS